MSGGNEGKGTTANCQVCGKIFTKKTKSQITCGQSCGARWRAEQRRKNKGPKPEPKDKGNCTVCGTSLNGLKGKTTYCSEACAKVGTKRNAKLRAAKKPPRECELCGKAYTPRYHTQRFCSRRCARKSNAMGRVYGQNQLKRKEVLLMIVKEVPVAVEMRPKVGKIYLGLECWGQSGRTMIIPEIGRLGLIVREDEAKVVQGV